jgi:hypothetical protein
VRRGPLSSSELKALRIVDGSCDSEEKDNLLNRLGLYLADSPLGKALFKPRVFHIWPSPAGSIAGALESMHSGSHMGCIRSKAWVTERDVVYVQDGYMDHNAFGMARSS